jgi:hypothetical protein
MEQIQPDIQENSHIYGGTTIKNDAFGVDVEIRQG